MVLDEHSSDVSVTCSFYIFAIMSLAPRLSRAMDPSEEVIMP